MASETKGSSAVEALLKEKRRFPPPKEFVKHANVKSAAVYKEAAKNPARFWERFAKELDWFKPWKKALEWKVPYAKWFVGGKLNVSYNCLDRHINTARRTKAALIWEGEPGDTRTLTYWDLYREVNRFASAMKRAGVKRGDRVTIYMPMVPETAIAMLACTRIGATHTVVFGGFSAEALAGRGVLRGRPRRLSPPPAGTRRSRRKPGRLRGAGQQSASSRSSRGGRAPPRLGTIAPQGAARGSRGGAARRRAAGARPQPARSGRLRWPGRRSIRRAQAARRAGADDRRGGERMV
jgi:hypothetical protein